ncbi:MAG: hypothetical protein ACRDQA_06950, partial [Nocardioidaceae bacterium]
MNTGIAGLAEAVLLAAKLRVVHVFRAGVNRARCGTVGGEPPSTPAGTTGRQSSRSPAKMAPHGQRAALVQGRRQASARGRTTDRAPPPLTRRRRASDVADELGVDAYR